MPARDSLAEALLPPRPPSSLRVPRASPVPYWGEVDLDDLDSLIATLRSLASVQPDRVCAAVGIDR